MVFASVERTAPATKYTTTHKGKDRKERVETQQTKQAVETQQTPQAIQRQNTEKSVDTIVTPKPVDAFGSLVIVIQEPFGQSWDGIRPTVLAEGASSVVVAAGIVVVGHGGRGMFREQVSESKRRCEDI